MKSILLRMLAGAAVWTTSCSSAQPQPPVIQPVVVAVHPHDIRAFTEGLFYRDGFLYESTGMAGHSEIRRVRISDGAVVARAEVARPDFGEGIVDWKGTIVSLTWKGGIGYRWRLADLTRTGSFRYPGEGWALTRSNRDIYMSDGTPTLRRLDPDTLVERGRIQVTYAGKPLSNINELEWIDGRIWANIWGTTTIVEIDPADGRVVALVDLTAIAARQHVTDPDSVANGIAWDGKGHRIFVTGKNWDSVYEIRMPSPAIR